MITEIQLLKTDDVYTFKLELQEPSLLFKKTCTNYKDSRRKI